MVNLFLTILYMFELIVLFIVIVILCFTLVPAAISAFNRSEKFLHHSLITLAVLFTLLTIVSDLYNYALGIYHTQSYKRWGSSVTNGLPNPIQKSFTYANANKTWVLIMIIVFAIMMTYFSRQ